MYNWLVFLHVLSSLLLMLAHGVHAAIMLKFRGEEDPEKTLTFFNVIYEIGLVRYLTVAMGVFGLAAAFLTPWWRHGWPWLSAGIYVIVSWVMYKYGSGYYTIIEDAATHLIEAKKMNINQPAAQKEFDDARNAPHIMFVSIVGIVGLAIILWLMRFKPF